MMTESQIVLLVERFMEVKGQTHHVKNENNKSKIKTKICHQWLTMENFSKVLVYLEVD